MVANYCLDQHDIVQPNIILRDVELLNKNVLMCQKYVAIVVLTWNCSAEDVNSSIDSIKFYWC